MLQTRIRTPPPFFTTSHTLLGGGASLVVAPYPFAFATLFFNGRMPESVTVVGQVDEGTAGVDLQVAMALSFSPTSNLASALA